MAGKVGEITCTLDEVGELQKEYKIGNIRQRKNGLALRVVGDELPEEAVKVLEIILTLRMYICIILSRLSDYEIVGITEYQIVREKYHGTY